MARTPTRNYCFNGAVTLPSTYHKVRTGPELEPYETIDAFNHSHFLDPDEACSMVRDCELSNSVVNVTNSSTILQNITLGSAKFRESLTLSRHEISSDVLPSKEPLKITVCAPIEERRSKQLNGVLAIGPDSWNTGVFYYQNTANEKPAISIPVAESSNKVFMYSTEQPLGPAPSKPLPAVPTMPAFAYYPGTCITSSPLRAKKDSRVSIDSNQDSFRRSSSTRLDADGFKTPTWAASGPVKLQSPLRFKARSEKCKLEVSEDSKFRKLKAMNRKLRDLRASREHSICSGLTPLPSPAETSSPAHDFVLVASRNNSSEYKSEQNQLQGDPPNTFPMKPQQLNLSFTPIMLVAEQMPITYINKASRIRPNTLAQIDCTELRPNVIAVRADLESSSKSLMSPPEKITNSLPLTTKSSSRLYGSQFPAPPARSNSSSIKKSSFVERFEPKTSGSSIEMRQFVSLMEESKVLRQRNIHLEKQNKMLEAALMVALRTAGRLNGCPCGEQTLRSTGDCTTERCLDDGKGTTGHNKLNAMEIFYRTRTRIDQAC